MRVTCPNCGRKTAEGRFCERCGKPLPETPRAGDEPTETPSPLPAAQAPIPPVAVTPFPAAQSLQPAAPSVSQATPTLEMDTMCVLFEDLAGFLRFRFNPRTTAENVIVTLENPLTGTKVASRVVAYLQGMREITVPVPEQEAGAFVWYLTLTYEASGRKRRLEGEVQMVVVRPREAQKAADQLTVTINNNITNGNASDVRVSQQAVEELSRLATAENPFEELRRIVLGGKRVWATVSLDVGAGMPSLPVQPSAAVRDVITLDLEAQRVHFFAKRRVTFGRDRRTDPCDISLRHPMRESLDLAPTDPRNAPYRSVSGHHCHFEHSGDEVVVCDGSWDGAMMVKPSSFGTFWNGERIQARHALVAGDEGIISFSGVGDGCVSLEAKACRPIRACGTCPHANRTWCGDGRRPALMLTRRDGVAERFVALWSCFPLEEADPSFEGVVIFRKDGGFAWRRGRRCGWLVPGETLETDFGLVTVS